MKKLVALVMGLNDDAHDGCRLRQRRPEKNGNRPGR